MEADMPYPKFRSNSDLSFSTIDSVQSIFIISFKPKFICRSPIVIKSYQSHQLQCVGVYFNEVSSSMSGFFYCAQLRCCFGQINSGQASFSMTTVTPIISIPAVKRQPGFDNIELMKVDFSSIIHGSLVGDRYHSLNS